MPPRRDGRDVEQQAVEAERREPLGERVRGAAVPRHVQHGPAGRRGLGDDGRDGPGDVGPDGGVDVQVPAGGESVDHVALVRVEVADAALERRCRVALRGRRHLDRTDGLGGGVDAGERRDHLVPHQRRCQLVDIVDEGLPGVHEGADEHAAVEGEAVEDGVAERGDAVEHVGGLEPRGGERRLRERGGVEERALGAQRARDDGVDLGGGLERELVVGLSLAPGGQRDRAQQHRRVDDADGVGVVAVVRLVVRTGREVVERGAWLRARARHGDDGERLGHEEGFVAVRVGLRRRGEEGGGVVEGLGGRAAAVGRRGVAVDEGRRLVVDGLGPGVSSGGDARERGDVLRRAPGRRRASGGLGPRGDADGEVGGCEPEALGVLGRARGDGAGAAACGGQAGALADEVGQPGGPPREELRDARRVGCGQVDDGLPQQADVGQRGAADLVDEPFAPARDGGGDGLLGRGRGDEVRALRRDVGVRCRRRGRRLDLARGGGASDGVHARHAMRHGGASGGGTPGSGGIRRDTAPRTRRCPSAGGPKGIVPGRTRSRAVRTAQGAGGTHCQGRVWRVTGRASTSVGRPSNSEIRGVTWQVAA